MHGAETGKKILGFCSTLAKRTTLAQPNFAKKLQNRKRISITKPICISGPSADGLGAWLLNDSTSVLPSKEKIDEVWRPICVVRSSTNYKIDEDYVAVISYECAVYVFKGFFTITSKEGHTTDPTPMSGSYVYVLRNDEWKILHTHQSWKND